MDFIGKNLFHYLLITNRIFSPIYWHDETRRMFLSFFCFVHFDVIEITKKILGKRTLLYVCFFVLFGLHVKSISGRTIPLIFDFRVNFNADKRASDETYDDFLFWIRNESKIAFHPTRHKQNEINCRLIIQQFERFRHNFRWK